MGLLQDMITNASQKYYTTGKSDLSDEEFDALLERERKENPNSPLLQVGHGYNVDEDTTYGEKVSHRYGLVGSLPKCKIFKDFIAPYKDRVIPQLVASTKLDGLSIVLYFNDGNFTQAVTRGDGYQGIDVTDKVRKITHITSIADTTFTGAIRGEVVMSNTNFDTFKKLHPEAKNSRNSAAGLMNGKVITSDHDFLDIIFYTIMGSENRTFSEYTDVLKYLEDQLVGQKIVKYTTLDIHSIYDDNSLLEEMTKLRDAWYGEYPCDGIVLASDELNIIGSDIGYISNAFKFKAESKDTTVTGIEWNLSKTGYLVPRIRFEPIELSGATVQYCAGHNALNIRDIGIGVGARIKVTRSNEVIPYLEEVYSKGQGYHLPRVCPSCGTTLELNGVHLQCPNRDCKNSDVQDALIWMANIVPADGLGDTLKLKYLGELLGEDNISIDAMYAHGPIEHINSAYVKERLFNETFNRMFTDQIRLDAAIRALNIPRFGDVTATKLARYSEEIQKVFIDGRKVGPMQQIQYLEVLKSVGAANYQSLMDNRYKMTRLNLIKDQIIWADNSGSDYRGDVVITGKLSVKRAVFEEELRKAGYVATSSVKKDTKYLITDDPNSGSSKNRTADKYGIPKITEREFRSRFM
ncbi:MAG: hypothetical protein NC548_51485 [Lachnospiraceae bacterium]|nr:hypothetical protein [Lachnospiraceae bacterium]